MTEITAVYKSPFINSKSPQNVVKKPRYALTSISNLPEKLQRQILAKLPHSDIYLNTPVVCTRWNHLDWDRKLHWKILDAGKDITKEHLIKRIAASPRLEHLILTRREDANEILMEVSKYCENLKTLKIINKKLFTIAEDPLFAMLLQCPRLCYLEFQGGVIDGLSFFSKLRRLLKNMSNRTFVYSGLISMDQLRKLGVTAYNARNEFVKQLLQKNLNVYVELTIGYKNKHHQILF